MSIVNAHQMRRHLTAEEKREIAVSLRRCGWTLERIAGALGVSAQTVLNWTGDTEAAFQNLKVAGRDGKSRPAKYRPRTSIFCRRAVEESDAVAAVHELQEAVASDKQNYRLPD